VIGWCVPRRGDPRARAGARAEHAHEGPGRAQLASTARRDATCRDGGAGKVQRRDRVETSVLCFWATSPWSGPGGICTRDIRVMSRVVPTAFAATMVGVQTNRSRQECGDRRACARLGYHAQVYWW